MKSNKDKNRARAVTQRFLQHLIVTVLPVNKVGGAIDRVDNPSGIVREGAGGACCYGLLAYKASK